ncbi:TetR/AcrR family transcriptional regulator [Kibdelosporangium philippinense]|uniref:TetR/AcrR family transcriptional regulator n=1 Tax=Kibdelosporangium philippinense TaxID=211113 RepID=A0ABS8Z6K7_9PSEU|nr:TetR/AcrR family transcriptional regulator [Kibdelosporangium philippinense]MCE7002425.1 TetR/AcrR family transcriptional regulator [Kibdelosporangium philippinense]
MTQLAEQESARAARILAAARELILKRGFKAVTIAEIAERAHVGKGTVYLYWKTKEDLAVGLFGRDFLAAIGEWAELIKADPAMATPTRLIPLLLGSVGDHPFMHGIQTNDEGLLGVLVGDPRTRQLLDTVGPGALATEALQVWRMHGLARTDWTLSDQAYALRALILGFFTLGGDQQAPDLVVDDPTAVLVQAVTRLLGPFTATEADIEVTANAAVRRLEEYREQIRTSL